MNPNGSEHIKIINYSDYEMTLRQFLFYTVSAGVVFFLIGILFYKNFIVAGLLSGLGFFYPRMQRKKLIEKRKLDLNHQFKQAILSLSSSLIAGRSIENSFQEISRDLLLLYPDPNTYIIREINLINRRVENGETIERAIEDLSRRADIEDISNFADVFITCKRTGGNLVEVVRRTANIISEKLDIQQEIQVMVAQKRFESRALSIAPLALIGVLSYLAGDYLQPLYDFPGFGPVIMTISLGILIFSFWICQRIMNIKV